MSRTIYIVAARYSDGSDGHGELIRGYGSEDPAMTLKEDIERASPMRNISIIQVELEDGP